MHFLLSALLIISLTFNTLYNVKSILALGIILTLLALNKITKKKHIDTKIITISGLYCLASYASYFFSTTKNIGFDELILETLLILLFILLIHDNGIKHKKILYTLIFLGIIESFIGISQFFLREENRIAGSFYSWYAKAEYYPNALGLFYLLVIPITYILKNKLFYLTSNTLLILGLLLTASRGAILIFLVQIVIILFLHFKHSAKKQAVTFIISIIIATSIFGLLTSFKPKINISEKILITNSEKLTSVNERLQFFHNTPHLIKQKPLLGYGPSSFPYIYPQQQPLFLANAPHPHNFILKIGVERGLITLLFLSLFILIMIKQTSRFNYITLSILAGLTHNLIDFNFNFTSNFLIFIILLSINYKTDPDSKHKHYLHLLITLITVPLIFIFFVKEYSLRHNPNIHLNYKNSNLIINTQESLKNQTKINQFDAEAEFLLGQMSSDPVEQLKHYKIAKTLDPKNHWKYHLNYYKNLNKIDKNEVKAIKEELQKYVILAKQNIHYTARHQNIKDAIKLSHLLYEQTKDEELKTIYKDLIQAQKFFSSN